MTQQQEAVLARVRTQLAEHFNSSVLVVQAVDAENREHTEVNWSGGLTLAIGMLEVTKNRLIETRRASLD